MNIRQIARDSARRHMAVLAEIEEGLPIPVIPCEDEPTHTDESPWCNDQTCPCHDDQLQVITTIDQLYQDGLITYDEGNALYRGRNI